MGRAWRWPAMSAGAYSPKGMKQTGSENYDGSIVTAGGLLFIGATNRDKISRLRLTHRRTALGDHAPFFANASAAIYEPNGRHYVVVLANGRKSRDEQGGIYVAFRLPTQ
jgi:quinoprotein glucose dehydrogenase